MDVPILRGPVFFLSIQESSSYVCHNSSGYKRIVTIETGCCRVAYCKKMWRGKKPTLFSKQSRSIGNRKVKMGMVNSVKGRNVTSHRLLLSFLYLDFPFFFFISSFLSLLFLLPSFPPSFFFQFSLFLSLFFPLFSFYLSPSVWCVTSILLRIVVIKFILSAWVMSKDVSLVIDLTPCLCQVLCFSQMMPLPACRHGSQQSRQGACVAPLSCSWKQAWHHHLSDSWAIETMFLLCHDQRCSAGSLQFFLVHHAI